MLLYFITSINRAAVRTAPLIIEALKIEPAVRTAQQLVLFIVINTIIIEAVVEYCASLIQHTTVFFHFLLPINRRRTFAASKLYTASQYTRSTVDLCF